MTQPRIRNIGKVSSGWLHDAGIHTLADLEDLGAVEAYKRVKALYPERVSLNLLYGLQAALFGIRWTDLTPNMKADLRAQVEL
jgi:DNA transformation protein and related proteins